MDEQSAVKHPGKQKLSRKRFVKYSQKITKITMEANHKTTNFHDITMDLKPGKYKPYIKPNNIPLDIHKESNHPANIIKNIPKSINKRLSNISTNESTVNKAAPPYQESGYKYTLKYKADENKSSTESMKRKCRK